MQSHQLMAILLGTGIMSAQAAPVTHMTLADTINASTNSLGTDGKSGAFRFSPINPTTYTGASLFDPANGGVISHTYDVFNLGAATAPLDWTNGFMFAGSPFQPFTTGVIIADIGSGVLTISSLPFAGYYVGADFVFNMTPDSINVINLIETDDANYAYRIGFSHYITSTDDPSLTYVGFTANWILEGTMSIAMPTGPEVPEPETYAMMLAGLGLTAAIVRRRKALRP